MIEQEIKGTAQRKAVSSKEGEEGQCKYMRVILILLLVSFWFCFYFWLISNEVRGAGPVQWILDGGKIVKVWKATFWTVWSWGVIFWSVIGRENRVAELEDRKATVLCMLMFFKFQIRMEGDESRCNSVLNDD